MKLPFLGFSGQNYFSAGNFSASHKTQTELVSCPCPYICSTLAWLPPWPGDPAGRVQDWEHMNQQGGTAELNTPTAPVLLSQYKSAVYIVSVVCLVLFVQTISRASWSPALRPKLVVFDFVERVC